MELADIAKTAFELLLPLLGLLAGWLGVKLGELINTNVKSAVAKDVLSSLSDTIITLVREAEQTIVAGMKSGRTTGSKLSSKEAASVRDQVLNKLYSLWGLNRVDDAAKADGIAKDKVKDWLIAKIEAAVAADKK